MANITISNNTFNDNSSAIREVHEAPETVDYARIEEELHAIKNGLKKGSQAYKMVEDLEKGSKDHSWDAICATIKAFAFQFSSATLANLAGSYLSRLLGL